MKRIKIMLSAFVVLAAVGGALAFKAQKFGTPSVHCYFPEETATCPLLNFSINQNGASKDPCGTGFYYTENQCQTSFSTTNRPVYTLTVAK